MRRTAELFGRNDGEEEEKLSSSIDVILKNELILSFVLKQKNGKKEPPHYTKSQDNRNTPGIEC